MRSPSRHSAYFLLFTFVVGGLIAPASHYVFMMFSDAYRLGDHHELSAGHHGQMHHAHPADTARVDARDADKLYIECKYADLFATFAAAGHSNLASLDAPPLLQVLTEKPVRAPYTHLPIPFHQRGPPHLS